MAKREFVMLAHKRAKKHMIAGLYASEKLDGMRAVWDGGISRWRPCSDIPWANTEKDARLLEEPIATGLWSRYGKVIHAPHWWLDKLPINIPLDGELYIGRQTFQQLISITKKLNATEDWNRIKYSAFDIPSYLELFKDGVQNSLHFRKTFKDIAIPNEVRWRFRQSVVMLKEVRNEVVQPVEQTQLPFNTIDAEQMLDAMMFTIVEKGGEGIMLRDPDSIWMPERSHDLIKVKPSNDAEGIIRGYISGERTAKGSKLLGLIGSVTVQFNGHLFQLSGFTDEERELGSSDARTWAESNPGQEIPLEFDGLHFRRGMEITFKYRELTDDGLPKEARYFRNPSKVTV